MPTVSPPCGEAGTSIACREVTDRLDYPEGGRLRRVPCQPYVEELRRWQRRLKRVTALDEDPFDTPVELQDVIDGARRLKTSPDKDWT